jgi:predicted RNase H-like HicB family nuclease
VKYPIAIEPGNDKQAFGVVIPDLPGCFSAGDTFDEALDNAKEAAEAWLEATIEDGRQIPEASPITAYRHDEDYKGWIWGFIDVDIGPASCHPVAFSIHSQ